MPDINWSPKYLHIVSERVSWMSHHVHPNIRAMFAAMMSRVPVGGIVARYREVVEKIAGTTSPRLGQNNTYPLYHDGRECQFTKLQLSHTGAYLYEIQYVDGGPSSTITSLEMSTLRIHPSAAEEYLTKLVDGILHPVIQVFFDNNVLNYGHGSIKELSGFPVIFIEGCTSWFAYQTFDNPLVMGQEMSTRAVWRKDWPMGFDAHIEHTEDRLVQIHALGLEIAKHEIAAQKIEVRKSCPDCLLSAISDEHVDEGRSYPCETCNDTGRKYPTIDPQADAFRPAFDRARWALPNTISTGVAHTANIRVMSRVIKAIEDMATLSGSGGAAARILLDEVKIAYNQAMPGLEGMWYAGDNDDGNTHHVPYHLTGEGYRIKSDFEKLPHEILKLSHSDLTVPNSITDGLPPRNEHGKYLDPSYNQVTADVNIHPSWAAMRDWHRHRTFFPWKIQPILLENAEAGDNDTFLLHPDYAPISDFGKDNAARYFRMCYTSWYHFRNTGDLWSAWLCLPFGATLNAHGNGGLRDLVYMSELRSGQTAKGVNFEYQRQAESLLRSLIDQLGTEHSNFISLMGPPAALMPPTEEVTSDSNRT